MHIKPAVVIILYHPTQETIANIDSYYDFFDKFFVFDNTEAGTDLQSTLQAYSKIDYHHDGQNRGISERLNSAAKLAMAEGYQWLFTLDQDSNFSSSVLSDYLQSFEAFEPKDGVAMFGIEHESFKLKDKQVDGSYAETDHLITSGTLNNLAAWGKLGGFDENLFIDLVDIEYSIRAIKAGYKIIQFNGILFSHCVGKKVKRASIKSLFLVKKEKEIHSAIRCYYMYRNSFYMQEKHKGYDAYLMNEYRHSAVDRVWNCLYYGRDTWKIIKYMLRAKSDFLHKRMGKIGDNKFVKG